MGFSGFGVNFMDSTTERMGLNVLRAKSDAAIDQLFLDFIFASALILLSGCTSATKRN